jgi:hypothetical protein
VSGAMPFFLVVVGIRQKTAFAAKIYFAVTTE